MFYNGTLHLQVSPNNVEWLSGGNCGMKKYNDEIAILEQRDYKIVKANELIQKARNNLSLVQLKTLAYILSKIKPTDKPGKYYSFSIKEYCKICDIDEKSGTNYAGVKAALKSLRDKSFWLTDEDGKDVLVAWIDKPKIDTRSKKFEVRLDEDIQKYLIGWLEQYTQYSLWEVVPMQSRYSFVLFENLESYSYQKEHTFDIDDLKSKIGATRYVNFKDFRKKVLEVATREINQYTNLEIKWEPVTKGKKVIQVTFYIKKRSQAEIFKAQDNSGCEGQTNIFDFIPDPEEDNVNYSDNMITITKG